MNFFNKSIIYLLGIFITAIGINISKIAGLGVSPVSSLPYVLELITGLTLGTTSIIVYTILIFVQWLILGKEFKKSSFLQLICTVAFGYFINMTDDNYIFLSWLPQDRSYLSSLSLSIISCVVIGIGVYTYLFPNFYSLPAEGLMKAIHQGAKGKFAIHHSKIITDVSLLGISLILSLIFLHKIEGIREGTFIAASTVGIIIGYCKKIENIVRKKRA